VATDAWTSAPPAAGVGVDGIKKEPTSGDESHAKTMQAIVAAEKLLYESGLFADESADVAAQENPEKKNNMEMLEESKVAAETKQSTEETAEEQPHLKEPPEDTIG
jgi:hypothetical protein